MLKRIIFLAAIFCSIFSYVPNIDFSLAQNMTIETIPPEVDESGNTTEERIDQIVVTLRILAGLVVAGTVGYWWHTKPKKLAMEETNVIEADHSKIEDAGVTSTTGGIYEDVEENN